jgi:hypothetical protein
MKLPTSEEEALVLADRKGTAASAMNYFTRIGLLMITSDSL